MISKQQFNEWLKRLHSGDYKQGQGMLKIIGNEHTGEPLEKPLHCCLGVLGEILCEAGKMSQTEDDVYTHFWKTYDAEGSETAFDALLPVELINSDAQNQLASANDAGKSFAEIALMIEKRKDQIVDPHA